MKSLITQQFYTEYDICGYIRQVLEGLEYMHDRWIAHLGLNVSIFYKINIGENKNVIINLASKLFS